MAEQPRRFSEIRDWIQTIVIILGVVFGLWQFMFKEIWTPAAAPINVTTEVTIREVGFKGARGQDSKEQFEAIELTIAAKNPSSRDVFLLDNCWFAEGFTILTRKQKRGWAAAIAKQIKEIEPAHHGAYFESVDKGSVMAAGAVFREDQVLHPNELISTSVVFYVPQDVYDMLYVHVEVPTIAVHDSAEVEWNWKMAADQGCSCKTYRKRNGVRAEEITDYYLAFLDRDVQFQAATSTRELSLWQSKPPVADSGTSRPATR